MKNYNDLIDTLYLEHQKILEFAEKLREELLVILEGKEIDFNYFDEAIFFIRDFADRTHHKKEEDILFNKMIEEIGPLAEKIINNGMLVEHDLGRYSVMELEKAIERYKEDNSIENKLDIIGHGMGYIYLINRHIEKEDQALFKLAREKIGHLNYQG